MDTQDIHADILHPQPAARRRTSSLEIPHNLPELFFRQRILSVLETVSVQFPYQRVFALIRNHICFITLFQIVQNL